MRQIANEVRYRRARRRARVALRNAIDRGGRTCAREDLYQRVRAV